MPAYDEIRSNNALSITAENNENYYEIIKNTIQCEENNDNNNKNELDENINHNYINKAINAPYNIENFMHTPFIKIKNINDHTLMLPTLMLTVMYLSKRHESNGVPIMLHLFKKAFERIPYNDNLREISSYFGIRLKFTLACTLIDVLINYN